MPPELQVVEPPPFATIEKAAHRRHGADGVEARLTVPLDAQALRARPDDRYLSAMALRTFRAGLKHELVDRKWPAFEEVFKGFDVAVCARLYDEDLEAMLEDRRLVRHMGKLRAVRANAVAMLEVAAGHGSVGAWLAGWPGAEVVALWAALEQRFQQMGGNSGPSFLRMVGKDTFMLTDSVISALVHWRAIREPPRGKGGRAAVQSVFNAWAEETGRPLCQLSQILALSAD